MMMFGDLVAHRAGTSSWASASCWAPRSCISGRGAPRCSSRSPASGDALDVPVELFIGRWGFHMVRGEGLELLFFVVGVTRHLVFYGGLALGMRTLAQEST